MLTVLSQRSTPGAVVRPLVDPVPVFPWSMLWLGARGHRGLDVLHAAIDELDERDGWTTPPDDCCRPEPG